MKRFKSYVFPCITILLAVSCTNSGMKRTKSGLLYKIISEEKGPVVKRGEFLKMSFTQKVKDSVLFTSTEGIPAYLRVDSTGPNYTVSEVLPLLRKGDSAVIVQLADSIQRKSGQPLPPFIKKRDKIVLTVKVLDIFSTQDAATDDRTAALKKERDKESKILEDYISANKINAQKTGDGVWVDIKNPGDGPAVDSGKQVSVRYTGKSFPEGKVFESNMTGPGNEPVKFVIGAHQIIPGWDQGLRLFKKGGKGTLYIPAYLAYDITPGPNHKPFENLMFDVEVVDVTDAPKPVARPTPMPPARMVPGARAPQKN